VDREDQAVAEGIPRVSVITLFDQTRGDQHLVRKILAAQGIPQGVPTLTSASEAEVLDHLGRDSSRPDGRSGIGPGGLVTQQGAEVFVGGIEGLAKPGAAGSSAVVVFVVLPAEFNACPFGEELQGFAKFLAEVLLDEAEAIPGGPAGVALVEGGLLVGDDRKGGAAVIVERTQPDVLTPPRLEGDVLADQVDQIDGLPHSFDFISRCHANTPHRRHSYGQDHHRSPAASTDTHTKPPDEPGPVNRSEMWIGAR
jgi:hypothetical protein